MRDSFDSEELLEEVLEYNISDTKDLVVFNDEVNTFDHVINTLIKVCRHTAEQAEQCTVIIHYNGKCCVKKGSFEELTPLQRAISDAGISVDIH